jgi:hypothetical protein
MGNLIKNRLGLSTVVTALTILIVSILLVTILGFYAENRVDSRASQEALTIKNQHVWNNPNSSPGEHDYSEAAFLVVNTLGKDIVIERISVFEESCPWNEVTTLNGVTTGQFVEYYSKPTPISSELQFQTNFNAGPAPSPMDNHVTIAGEDSIFKVATGQLVIEAGSTMVIYVINPPEVDMNKIGMTIGISIFTAETIYIVQANIQGLNTG